MRRYRYILLDADMTLFDFARSEKAALRRTLNRFGLTDHPDVTANYLKINSALWDAFGKGQIDQDFLSRERFAALLRLYGGNADPNEMNRHYLASLGEEAHLLPGALEFCRVLKDRGLTLAIATNGMPVAQRGRYTRTGLDGVIPNLFISMELGVQKPLPAFFDKVCQAMGITDRSQAVMVGDSLSSDVAGGNRAGIDTIWFNPGHIPLAGSAQPTYTAASYEEMLQILI